MNQLPKNKCLLNKDQVKAWLREQVSQQAGRETITITNTSQISVVKLVVPESERVLEPRLALTLTETDTLWLMCISSCYNDLNETPKDTIIETFSSWKCLNAESQTAKNSEKSKNCETLDVKATSSYVNASAWDLYDTYAQVGLGIKEFQMLIDTALKTRGVVQAQPGFASEITRMPAEKQMKRLVRQESFQYCVLVIERLLASKTFESKQRLLKGEIKDETVLTSVFSYQVSLLWTYDNHFMTPLAVTCLDWNPKNNILLAVSYGSVSFRDEENGCVCIWSPKNPCHPERKIYVKYSVTTVCFSKEKANILAAGCRNGHILLIDVAFTEPVVRLFLRKDMARHGPIWKVEWFNQITANGGQEHLLALGDSGYLSCYSVSTTTSCKSSHDILNLDYTMRIEQASQRKGVNGALFRSKALSGLSFSLVANNHFCYIATKQGVVVKCKTQAPCCKDLYIAAHLGPVHVIQHSPVCSRIFLTCGSDHFLKIWIDTISEPLLSLTSNLQKAMVCAQWSPILPTMIASVSTTELIIWDIARKSTQPINTLTVRSVDLAFSTLKFFADGTGLAVGDQQGHVKIYQLSNLPRPPHLRTEALISAVRNSLVTNPNLLYKFNKLLHFTTDQETCTPLK